MGSFTRAVIYIPFYSQSECALALLHSGLWCFASGPMRAKRVRNGLFTPFFIAENILGDKFPVPRESGLGIRPGEPESA